MPEACKQTGCEEHHRVQMIVLSLLFLIVFPFSSYASEITIGLIPGKDVFEQVKRYRMLGDYIEKKTGTKMIFTILPGYGNIIENFRQKNMDGAFWGSFTGALALKQLDIKPVARPVYRDKRSMVRGYVFVHKYSFIDNVKRMEGSVIAFVDRATTTGYVFPMAFLRENGISDIDAYFSEYYFTGSDEAAVYAVLNKEADVGCAADTVFDALAERDPEIKDSLMILAASPDVPHNVLALRKDVPLAVRESIKKVLTDMDKDSRGREIIRSFGAVRFAETGEDEFNTVFNIAAKAGLSPEAYRYSNR